MTGAAIAELAERAGVAPAFVERLVDEGILVVDGKEPSVGDIRRVRVIDALMASGIPIEGIGAAIRDGRVSLAFVDQPSYGRFAAHAGETFRQVSERTGLPLESVIAVREASGSARPDADARIRDEELAIVEHLALLQREGVRPEVAERALRATGDAVRRVAEIEADWWGSDIMAPRIAQGMDIGMIGEALVRITEAVNVSSDRALLALYHGQQSVAWMRNILDAVEVTLAQAGLYSRLDRPPAIAFLDLSGYTRLTEERGDAEAAALASRLASMVQRTAGEHGGRAVKWLGDGVMFHFRDPGDAVVAALAMVDGAAVEGMPPAHVGIHAGPVLFQEGDYFGRTVNAAARIAAYARAGEVVVSQEVVAAAAATPVAFTDIGAVELKGLMEPLHLHVARRAA
jgi:class 3 adenylate cyclase